MSQVQKKRYGWDAINQHLSGLYPDQEPHHYGTAIAYNLGGPDPLEGISAYRSEQGQPHWHIVSFGMSNLYEPLDPPHAGSGFGWEFTFRLKREPDESEPPIWVINFLQNLARYCYDTGHMLDSRHHMDLNGPIAVGSDTQIRAIAINYDPELKSMKGPNGSVNFLQIYGMTLDELNAVRRWDLRKVIRLIHQVDPFLITDVRRMSYLMDFGFRQQVEQGISREGSSTKELYLNEFSWRKEKRFWKSRYIISISAIGFKGIKELLPMRIVRNLELTVSCGEYTLELAPAESPEIREEGEVLTLGMPPDLYQQLQNQPVRAGAFEIQGLKRVRFVIQQSQIRDENGNITVIMG